MRTVVALYNRLEDAQGAVQNIRDAGFDKSDINLVSQDANGEYTRYFENGENRNASEGAATGAGVGTVVGGLAGLVVGLGALAIPGIGPVLAAGPIVTTLAGAGAGAVAGGIVGALIDMGIPREHAEAYAEGIRRGGTLVTVRTPDDRSDDAVQILEQYSPVDINQQMELWRSQNWQGFDENAQPVASEQVDKIPVTGTDQTADIPIMEEEISGEEQTVDTGTGFQRFDQDFRDHYNRTYAAMGMDYNDMMPAYRFGYDLATESRFSDYDWNTIEPEAMDAWERRYGPDTWERVRDAVQYAWDTVRS